MIFSGATRRHCSCRTTESSGRRQEANAEHGCHVVRASEQPIACIVLRRRRHPRAGRYAPGSVDHRTSHGVGRRSGPGLKRAEERGRVFEPEQIYEQRKFSNFAAYGEAKVATTLYAMELAERLRGTGVTTASVHPGWARSNFGGGGNFMMRAAMTMMRPFVNAMGMTDSNEESAQTSLQVLLSDDAPKHSGAYFSQSSVLYRDAECKDGGWPMESPNPNARDMQTARKLVELSYQTVGMDAPRA